MKKTFLKFLPIVAAVLLATSCSKDNDGDNNVAPVPVETQNIASPTESSPAESNVVPFSIKVVTGNSLSKIGYTDDGSKVTTKFEESDKDKVVLRVASTDATIDLTLTEVDAEGVATFEGDWGETPEPTEGTEMNAYFYYNGESAVTTSTTSLPDLMKSCAHLYTGTFKYKTDDKVMLTDNNAYIEIIMSPLQKDIDLTIDGTPQNFAMADGKVWIAVADDTKFTTNFTAEKTCTAGKITTINRAGFVDLGIPSGILWADRNLGATSVYDYGNYYAWGEVAIKDDYSWDSYSYGRAEEGAETNPMVNKYCPTDKTYFWDGNDSPDDITTLEASDDAATATNTKWKMPEQSDFAALKDNCYWVWVTNYNSKSGYIVYKTKDDAHKGGVKFAEGKEGSVDYTSSYSVDKATHIFLPAAGYRDGTSLCDVGSNVGYWSSSLYAGYPSSGRILHFNSSGVSPDGWSGRYYGFSVRPVRCK